MPRAFLLISASVMTCALAGCENRVANSPKPSGRSPSVRVVSGFVIDSTRNQAIAAAINATTAPAVPVEVLDLNEDSVSDPIQLITAKIDTTVKLDAWLKGHPADRVSMVAIVGSSSDDTFCRAAVVKTRLGKRLFVRSAMFYIPVPPKGERLPTDTTGVAGACELRSMVLVSADTDIPTSKALLDSLTVVLDRRLGPHAEGDAVTGGGIRGADGERLWRQPLTSVVIATAPVSERTSARPESDPSDSAKGRAGKLFAVAYAPGSGAEDFDSWEARYDSLHALSAENRQLLYRSVDSAVEWAGITGLAADLKTVVAYLRTRDENKPGERRPSSIDVALIRALRAIHEGAPALPSSRRAAALLAGDIALAAIVSTASADSNSAILGVLPSLAISFDKDPEGYGYQNPRAWLWEAYRIDSTGRAGRAAFVELLGMQWPDDNSCAGDEYKRVIAHGEAALARGDDNPLIHYYVGSAYKTIYDLAHFANSEVGNPAAFKSQAEPARLKGIEHLRAALQSMPDRATRREAWMKAMRMILHRSGEQPEYVCFPD